MRVTLLQAAPPARAAELARILIDLEALASEIRIVSNCQTAILMAIGTVRACGLAWTGEVWGCPSPEASSDQANEGRSMRSTAEHVKRLNQLHGRLQRLTEKLMPGCPDDQALSAAILGVKLCAMEWTGDVFAFTPRKPPGSPMG